MAHREHNEIAEYHAEQQAARDPRLSREPAAARWSSDAAHAEWRAQEADWSERLREQELWEQEYRYWIEEERHAPDLDDGSHLGETAWERDYNRLLAMDFDPFED